MKIEVACRADDTTKVKGDLLEDLASDLLSAQSFKVIQEIRMTGVELDLLCQHEVSGKQVYVECKAHEGNLGAPVVRQLLGTVEAYDYAEGWLVSTADFGKEAKGFVEMWKNKPPEKASRLSFYSPEQVIKSLQKASVVCATPRERAVKIVGSPDQLGEWTLLISPYGRFWSVYTLKGGAPHGVLFFGARTGEPITDHATLANISTLKSVLCDYEIDVGSQAKVSDEGGADKKLPNVVEVQIGDSWNDYRPARPQDFIGREDVQKEIFKFLENARLYEHSTRIFAVTGNSGLGKSSLIAKIRERSRNLRYRKKVFTFAIDMRGARSPAYIAASIVKCLQNAQAAGFGQKTPISLTNPSTPLSSPSVASYLESVRNEGKFICLIFDQFEELYSKPDLYSVFTAAKELMIDVASAKSSLGLGFAWKTDSTTQQDHPAYHIWHELADHRREFRLTGFNKGEIAKAITSFTKQTNFDLPAEVRNQIVHSCQGFPWLLKKLCIHLYENQELQSGTDSKLLELDVSALFENDVQALSERERACLRFVAEKAPADWSEVIEVSGVATVNSLVSKRLVIRSGDRLNVYWDIFKDYILTGAVPVVPFNYIPTSDVLALLRVGNVLAKGAFETSEIIAERADLKDRTVGNIGADLVFFGVAERTGTSFKLRNDIKNGSNIELLSRIRQRVDKHSLKLALFRDFAGQTIGRSDVKISLKACLPGERYNDRTWNVYVNRFINLLVQTGFLARSGQRFTVRDSGSATSQVTSRTRVKEVFTGMASPASVCDALTLLKSNPSVTKAKQQGYRNSISVLKRFNLIELDGEEAIPNDQALAKFGGIEEAVWTAAKNEMAITKCVDVLRIDPDISGFDLADFLAKEFDLSWADASKARTGNALRQWSNWVVEGIDYAVVPEAPGRRKAV